MTISNSAEFKPANFNYLSTNESLSDFSIAAEKTIHSVVHVKNLKEGNLVNNKAFEYFFGYPEKYVILAIIPSYLEREGSSLIYMVGKIITLSRKKETLGRSHIQRLVRRRLFDRGG